ncbi:MAG TPA: YHS domain-containing (seleno)protein [Chryseolinea sp.]|nr:YHS domain-containing (seleno)protein [Chryseolinea sp.]
MKTTTAIAALLFLCLNSYSQVSPVDNTGTSIGGYDVVSYFNIGKAVKGNPENVYELEGVRYLFSSKENQKLFEANPQKYLPQYDGYCALAVSYGKKISIDPKTFKIIDGKLYLFFNGLVRGKQVNSQDTWDKSEARLLQKADDLWPDVKKKKFKDTDSL